MPSAREKSPQNLKCQSSLQELLQHYMHVFNHTMGELLAGVPASPPPTQIAKSTLENATDLVHHLESQKAILCHVS